MAASPDYMSDYDSPTSDRRAHSTSPTFSKQKKNSKRKQSNDDVEPARSQSTFPGYSPRTREAGPYNATAIGRRLPQSFVVDFSYQDVGSLEQLLEMQARKGVLFGLQRHDDHRRSTLGDTLNGVAQTTACATAARTATTTVTLPSTTTNAGVASTTAPSTLPAVSNSALFYFGDRAKGKTQKTDDGIVVIKAKEENYAFKDEAGKRIIRDKDLKGYFLDAHGNLVKRLLTFDEEVKLRAEEGRLYRCTTLRLNNNRLESLDKLHRSVSLTLFKPMRFLVCLDLSSNAIAALPEDFAGLRLHTLLLHSNHLAHLSEVRKLGVLQETLRTLTLYENPIQVTVKNYRNTLLCALPWLTSLDDVHVTAKEKERLDSFVDMFVPKKARASTRSLVLPHIRKR